MGRIIRGLIALTFVLGLAVTGAAPAAAQTGSILETEATFNGKDLPVTLTVTYVCTEGISSQVFVFLEQRLSANQSTFGEGVGLNPEACTGSPQTLVIPVQVPVLPPGAPFRKGKATVQVTVFSCNEEFCVPVDSTGPVPIRIR
jgi:hypothetical protein